MLETGLRQCRQRAEHVPVLLCFAERGLDAPDADQDRRLDAEFLLDRAQRVVPLRQFALADGNARRRDHAGEIGGIRFAVFRLPPHRCHDAGVGGETGKGGIEGRAVNTSCRSIRP
jgi:hypothetical protein